MVNVSCSTKFHAFALAEQLDRLELLNKFYTIYHQRKNHWVSQFNKRKDPEHIRLDRIHTFPVLAPLTRLRKDPFANNTVYDKLVRRELRKDKRFKAFIGWSGMSVHSLAEVKVQGKVGILERGSCHISYQYELLVREYEMLGKVFPADHRVEEKEKQEYELADYITVPSMFAKRSFISHGFKEEKIFVNNFGVSSFFQPVAPRNEKFTILYVGSLTIQKGLIHLFRALKLVNIPVARFEVWFIGTIAPEIQELIPSHQQENWRFFGHVNHHDLPEKISRCSVMVHPSIQEGLSMVIPQVMSCGVPVIATTNTGGEDVIEDNVNGFIVPIRSPEAIADRILKLYEQKDLLREMQERALSYVNQFSTWEQYGQRYGHFINEVVKN
jgi:glycosyltransferase involved in cell wall biosynthesis